MRLHIIMGSALSGKTYHLARKMEQAHRGNPLSYTFLGPTGAFVKEFSEWFSRRLNSSILRSSFLVIDQFADDVYNNSHPGMIYADKHLLKVFVANILGSATPKDLGLFYPLKDSMGLIEFISEAVIEAKSDGEADLMPRLANDQARFLIQFVLKELRACYDASLFDTFDAYWNINPDEIREYITSRYGNRLFLDGFTNLSWAQMIFLSKIAPLFHEIFMTLDPALVKMENWDKFRDMLAAQSIEIQEEQLPPSEKITAPLERLLKDEGQRVRLEDDFIQVANLSDPEAELTHVCRDIKRRIVDDGINPNEIAVVLNNFSERAREFSRKLEEYGVPVKVSGEEPLSNSIAVQLLVMPFRVALAGYPSHMLISMLDHGLGLLSPPEFDLDGLEAIAKGGGLYIGPRRCSLKDRREEWKAKLDDHLQALMQRLEVLAQDDSVYDSDLQAKEAEIRLCQQMADRSKELFQALEGIEKIREGRADPKLFIKEISSWMQPLKARFLDKSNLETEAMAIARFEEVIGRLEVVVNTMGGRDLTLSDLMAFLEILLGSEEYKPSPPLSNKVEVLSLHSARFRHRSLKYIVDFNDGIFPSRRCNPLYSLERSSQGRQGYYQLKEHEQREALYSCLCASSRAVITYVTASREGELMMPSLWLDGWDFEKSDTLERMVLPMSPVELGTEFGRSTAQGVDPIVPDSAQGLVNPLKLYADSGFSWRIVDKAVVKSLVGRSLSYTRLSEFNKCPFKFFLRRMLRLEEQSDDLYELSPIEKGIAYHAALKRLYDWRQEENASWDQAIEDGKIREVVEGIVQRFLAANRVRSLPTVRRAIVEDVTSTVQGYLEFERDHPEKACIGEKTLVELPFNIRLGDMNGLASSCARKYGDMILRGRIDRIDINVAEKNKTYDLVLSDYKPSSGDWEQLKLYTLVLLSLDHKDLPKNPELMKSFFRIVKEGNVSKILNAFPSQSKMDLSTRPKSSLTFSDVDRDLLQTIDGILEQREFRPGKMIEEKGGVCYFGGLWQNCELILNSRGGMQ